MKKLSIIGLLTLMLVGLVTATPDGVFVDYHQVVTRDWAWDGDSWELGNYPTATIGFDIDSKDATEAILNLEEEFGTAWKGKVGIEFMSNSDTVIKANINSWTVNDPETTPATRRAPMRTPGSRHPSPFPPPRRPTRELQDPSHPYTRLLTSDVTASPCPQGRRSAAARSRQVHRGCPT